MNLLREAKKMMMRSFSKKDPRFSCDIDKQLHYLHSFQEPIDNVERSYFQYLCQKKVTESVQFFVLNMVSMFMIPIYKMRLIHSASPSYVSGNNTIAFLNDISHNIIPNSLQDEAGVIKYLITEENYFLDSEDIKYLRKIHARYPYSPYFLFKTMMKISMYSYAIKRYQPKKIIAYVEFSFTSSILTDYCRFKGVEHINVLHGEKPLYIRDTFVSFDKFYVWDDFYVDQFKKLRAEGKQFVVELPPAFIVSEPICKKFDFTYYLGNESRTVLKRICHNLKILHEKGYRVSIRPHPRYSDLHMIKEICKDIHIEDTDSVTIQNSIASTACAVALFSTVLNQSYCNGVKIAIDDISDAKRFGVLKSLNYFCLQKEHYLLSELLEEHA